MRIDWLALVLLGSAATVAPGTAHTTPKTADPVRLTNVINSYPSPSPHGDTIVFQSNRTGRFQIYTMKADGSDVRQLTNLEDQQGGRPFRPTASRSCSPPGATKRVAADATSTS